MSEIKVNDNNEVVLWSGRKSMGTSVLDALLNKGLLPAMLILLIDVIIFSGILIRIGPKSAAGYFWGNVWLHYIPLILYLLGAACSIILSRTTVYGVTNKYVYLQYGLVRKTVVSNDVDDIEYVSARRDFFDRITHTGDITVFTRDEVEKNGSRVPEEKLLEFRNIKAWQEVYGLIEKIRNRTGSLTDPEFLKELKNHTVK